MPKTNRNKVYEAIDSERDYQDARAGNSARENLDDNRDLGSMILLMDQYLVKTKAAFAGPHPQGKVDALEQLRKTVALGVLAMEYHGAPVREGFATPPARKRWDVYSYRDPKLGGTGMTYRFIENDVLLTPEQSILVQRNDGGSLFVYLPA